MEVVDGSNNQVISFSNTAEPHNISTPTKTISIPSTLKCQGCALRLSQLAAEISPDRTYISCAPINIGSSIPDGDTCSGNGKRVKGVCECNESFTGSHCQHYNECEIDSDCGKGGSCEALSLSSKVCFCPPDKHGPKCNKGYEEDVSVFDDSQYKMKMIGDNKIYWKIINDEIEMVLKYPGSSWAAIGWKPLNTKCAAIEKVPRRKMKKVEIKKEEHKNVVTTVTRRPVTMNRTSPCGENEEWSECPDEERSCEASCDWTINPDSIPTCTSKCGTPRCICKESFVRTSSNSTECIPFDACNLSEQHECRVNETWAQCGTACEPSCANMYDTSPCPSSCEKAACTCADNYVRHQGQCVYWGECPDLDEHFAFTDVSSINETVKTSENTVSSGVVSVRVPPTSCPVNETLNECGRACETDCVSIFVREQCSGCGQKDCSCIQGYARWNGRCVYWGDCPQDQMSLQPINRPQPTPRVMGSDCKGEWSFPPGCTSNCQYRVMWNYMDKTDEVEFSVESRLASNSWTGVGIGDKPRMEKADMYIVKSFNGKVTVHDMWSEGQTTPVQDVTQDIAVPNPMGSHSDGVLRARFKRRRISRDKETDIDLTDDHCFYMLYPVEGGRLEADGSIAIHTSTPFTSQRRVCFKSCNPKPEVKPESHSCTTEYRHPPECVGSSCEYIASWKYNSSAKDVRFQISARDLGRWTGIGFSKNGQMQNADIYTGWVYEGKAYMTDRFAYGRQLPAIDPSDRNDMRDIEGKIEDDMQTISFTRSLITHDALTDLPLDKCYYYLFPIGGGRVLARKSTDFHNPRTPIGFHDQGTPKVSPTKICICENGTPIPQEPPAVRRRRETPFNVPRNAFGDAEDITTGESIDPMGCVDMIVGSGSGMNGRVLDMYSIGTSSPLEDVSLGGEDSIKAASASYQDGITTVTFRRKLQATEPTDHSIVRGPMQVLWAKGVDAEKYRHITGGVPIKADPSFFSNFFKYHGMDNRGMITVDFFDDGDHEETNGGVHDCRGRMTFPHGCTGSLCHYIVSWESDGQTSSFHVQADIKPLQWTAIGFSENGQMTGSDVVVVSVLEDGKVTVIDQFMPSYGRPTIDRDQDIFEVSTKYSGGRVYANFSRDLKGVDGHDVSLTECRYFLYTPSPGTVDKGGELRKHSVTPTVSAGKVCLASCKTLPATVKPSTIHTPSTTPITTQSTTQPSTTTTVQSSGTTKMAMPPLHVGPTKIIPSARFALKVRITNREFVPDLANPKSEYYQSFTKDLKTAVDKALSLKWKDVRMGKVLSYSVGSVIALVEVEAVKSTPRPIEIKSVVEETAIRGHINGFNIEPTTVNVEEIPLQDVKQNEMQDFLMNSSTKTIIIGCSSVILFLCALGCICYMCCHVRRVSHQFSPMSSSNAKSYSDIPYKADYPAHPTTTGYAYGTLNIKKESTSTTTAGFENKAYQHQRHFSQATTASTKQSPAPSNNECSPAGIGETTYHEWLNKVASKPSSQQHEESLCPPARPPSAQPYVSYPNDPSAYYTLGGEHRTGTSRKPTY